LVGTEPGEAAGGGQQGQPLLAGVGLLPVESPLFGLAELSGLADLVGELGIHRPVELQWTARFRISERRVWHNPAAGGCERLGHLSRRLVDMAEDRQPPAWAQCLGRLRGAGDGIDPVPRLGGDHRVERSAVRVPGFERCSLDRKAAGSGELGHPRIRLYAEHGAAGRLELAGRDAGAAADVEHVRPGASGHGLRHQGAWVAGASAVVPRCVVAVDVMRGLAGADWSAFARCPAAVV